MKHLPIGIQTFEKIIRGNYCYVDKTEYMMPLVETGGFYFLARPRRFGKSLLLTTIKSFSEGKEELFRGLYIHGQMKEWVKRPVVHLDYSQIAYKSGVDIFEKSLFEYLQGLAREFGVEVNNEVLANFFRELIISLYKKYGKVVVLVDEYDKPLVDMLTKEAAFEENREVLRSLYGSMKGLDEYLHLVVLTGVSRFAKVGVFSGMNNLEDISMNPDFAALTGFTQEELEENFEPWLAELQQEFNMPGEDLMAHIRFMYNGYSWDGTTKLYNPFSILSLLKGRDFQNFWFSTGTPTFLTNLIKEQHQIPQELEGIEVTDLTGSSLNIRNLPLVPLLFQTGYLTVGKITREGFRNRYTLEFPNEEVRHSFITYLLAAFVEKDEFEIQPEALHLRDALRDENIPRFIELLTAFFAGIPARLHIPAEAYYHSLVYMLLRLVGVRLQLEKPTDKGYIDAVLELPDKVYVMETKFGAGSRIKNVKTLSKQALKQIRQKNYQEAYLGSGKRILLLGVGFLDKMMDGKMVEYA